MTAKRVFVTGGTGMVGRLLIPQLVQRGYEVQALVRRRELAADLESAGAELVVGDLAKPEGFADALRTCHIVVHLAAHVGDWGPAELFRELNVVSLEKMLTIVQENPQFDRWVQISSMGIYPARHHYGTDESEPIALEGIDGYTRTKAEAEILLKRHAEQFNLPVVILRPGFIYGPGDRHVVPRLIEKLHDGSLKVIGKGDKVLNNTYAGNLVDAILLSIEKQEALGETFNIRDERLVTRQEFISAICDHYQKPYPRQVPEWLARMAVRPIERIARFRGRKTAPLLTNARIKFMANNLDFSIDNAKRRLGYQPKVDFQEGIKIALNSTDAETKTAAHV